MFRKSILPLFFIILLIAALFRMPHLSVRPMHGDEAVNGLKLGKLLESGNFNYDPAEFHGPALYDLTLPFAWIGGAHSLSELNEIILRSVPAFFGMGLILLILLLPPFIPKPALLLMALLTAVSPIFTFYSRYYIHEILLVFFFFGALLTLIRYVQNQKLYWLIISGIASGFMIATKETWIIPAAASVAALVVVCLFSADVRKNTVRWIRSVPVQHWIVFSFSVGLIYILLFSSFFRNWPGVADGVRTYVSYFGRGQTSIHSHPWYQYFDWLWFFGLRNGTFQSELLIGVLAVSGSILILRSKKSVTSREIFYRFIFWFTAICAILFSIIPYKTPWNALLFWFGFIILAAAGIFEIDAILKTKWQKRLLVVLLFSGFVHLGWQSYEANYIRYAESANPYVYAHPVDDLFLIEKTIHRVAELSPDGFKLPIHTCASGNDYWPLPWYLRKFGQTGWWDHIDFEIKPAQVLIISPDLEDDLIHKLYEARPPGARSLYLPLFEKPVLLRPGKEVKIYIEKSVWDLFNSTDWDAYE